MYGLETLSVGAGRPVPHKQDQLVCGGPCSRGEGGVVR